MSYYTKQITDATLFSETSQRIIISGYTSINLGGQMRPTLIKFCLDDPVTQSAKRLIAKIDNDITHDFKLVFDNSGYIFDIEVIEK